MNFCFEELDFSTITNFSSISINDDSKKDINNIYDSTTNEVYRIKRLYKIDSLTENEIPSHLLFEYHYKWNPYTGEKNGLDEIGPLCFNALDLYDYFFANRYKGLWNPSEGQFEGYYGDMLGTGENIHIKSRGYYPEKYLFRIPIIDCYLPINHNYSIVTMGPLFDKVDLNKIDDIVSKYHKNKKNFTLLSSLRTFYDKALTENPDKNCIIYKNIILNNPLITSEREINYMYNRYWVDKIVSLKN